MPTLKEIIDYQEQLSETSSKDDRKFLAKIGKEMKNSMQKDFVPEKIFRLEKFLKQLHVKIEEQQPDELTEELDDFLIEIRGTVAGLVEALKKKKVLEGDFYTSALKAGKLIIKLSKMLPSVALPLIDIGSNSTHLLN